MANVNDIMNEIDRIEGAKSDLAGAIEEKGVEVPEGARINEYPSLVRQIEQGGTGVVRYDEAQTLSSAEKLQARDNIGAAGTKMGVISQTQTWTDSTPRTYSMSDQVFGAIPQANIDLFEAAGATFNAATGYFELNGLTDISYEEMKNIYIYTADLKKTRSDCSYLFYMSSGSLPKIRTVLPMLDTFSNVLGASNFTWAFYNTRIETFPMKIFSSNVSNMFRANNLLKNAGYINITNITSAGSASNAFLGATTLETAYVKGLKVNFSFESSSALTKDSLLYIINNEASTGAITIKLHSTVYAKCQIGGDWYSDVSTALSSHPNVSLQSA